MNRHRNFLFGVKNLMANSRYSGPELSVVKHAWQLRLICTLIGLDEGFHQYYLFILFFRTCEPTPKTSDLPLKARQLEGGIKSKE